MKTFLRAILATLLASVRADDATTPQTPTLAPPFPMREFVPNDPARGVIIFGSGDGGWSDIEQRVCSHLSQHSWYVVGVDFGGYAAGKYDQQKLGRDLASVAQYAATRLGNSNLPIIYGGWSMGAEQSVAAAASASTRPANLRGLLLLAPGRRGRFGLRFTDKLGIPPTGAGTFALSDFASALDALKVAQIHGGFDPLDNTRWLDGLSAPHKKWLVPHGWHDLGNASDAALQIIGQAVDWICTS